MVCRRIYTANVYSILPKLVIEESNEFRTAAFRITTHTQTNQQALRLNFLSEKPSNNRRASAHSIPAHKQVIRYVVTTIFPIACFSNPNIEL